MTWESIAEARLRACNEYKAENDRLRAEKAELWNTAIEECAQLIQEDFDRPDMAEAIRGLAKANETEWK